MFSKLTKSRSIEESNTGGSIVGAGVKVGRANGTGSSGQVRDRKDVQGK